MRSPALIGRISGAPIREKQITLDPENKCCKGIKDLAGICRLRDVKGRSPAGGGVRVLDGREQETLMRLLQKLREGDIVKFVKEIRMKRPGERGWESEEPMQS